MAEQGVQAKYKIQLFCVTGVPSISTACNTQHLFSFKFCGLAGNEPGVGWGDSVSLRSMCHSSRELSWASSSPGMAQMQESKEKHTRPQKAQSQKGYNVISALFLLAK